MREIIIIYYYIIIIIIIIIVIIIIIITGRDEGDGETSEASDRRAQYQVVVGTNLTNLFIFYIIFLATNFFFCPHLWRASG